MIDVGLCGRRIQFFQTFSYYHKKPYYGPHSTPRYISEGIKIIPKTIKNSRGIPEMNEKVKLAIKRQQLARNMKKIGEKSKKKKIFLSFFGNETNFWISC